MPPANLTAECPPLEPVQINDMGELLGVCLDDAAMYHRCRERHNALARWLTRED